MRISSLTLAFALLAAGAPVTAQHPAHDHGTGHGTSHPASAVSPYAEEQTRDIKALSLEEQRAWIEGQGMETHLKQTELLTAVQIGRYNTLRGYR